MTAMLRYRRLTFAVKSNVQSCGRISMVIPNNRTWGIGERVLVGAWTRIEQRAWLEIRRVSMRIRASVFSLFFLQGSPNKSRWATSNDRVASHSTSRPANNRRTSSASSRFIHFRVVHVSIHLRVEEMLEMLLDAVALLTPLARLVGYWRVCETRDSGSRPDWMCRHVIHGADIHNKRSKSRSSTGKHPDLGFHRPRGDDDTSGTSRAERSSFLLLFPPLLD